MFQSGPLFESLDLPHYYNPPTPPGPAPCVCNKIYLVTMNKNLIYTFNAYFLPTQIHKVVHAITGDINSLVKVCVVCRLTLRVTHVL